MNKPGIAVMAAGLLLSLSAAAERHATVELTNVWVRALPPTQTNTAAYLTITNRGESEILIEGATADVADKVEIHTTREIDGYMRMEQLQGLPIAAGQSVELTPGGTHLMLLGLERMPVPGEPVSLCLKLASGETPCVEAEVRKKASGNPGQTHQHHHQK